MTLLRCSGSQAYGVAGPPGAVRPVREAPLRVGARPRLADRLRQALRASHLSPRTEAACLGWIRRHRDEVRTVLAHLDGMPCPMAGLLQEPPGHRDASTTMICTHVLNRRAAAVRSPADRLFAP